MSAKRKAFVDTDVLVYQFDRTNADKQQTATTLIAQLIVEERLAISSQVVQEFITVALRKFATMLPVREVKAVMAELLEPHCGHFPTSDFYSRATELYATNSLSFYDALIVQAALDMGCDTLYSEDLQDGQQFGNLKVINPFKA